MRKKVLILFLFNFNIQVCLGQSISIDSSSAKRNDKVLYGFYAISTFSTNIGDMVVPYFPESGYCNCGYIFFDQNETGSIGLNFGFEIESKKLSKKISISSGLNLELFNYSGTAQAIHYNHIYPGSTTYGPTISTDYSYQDYYISLPILVHYDLSNLPKNRINVLLGFSGGLFLKESNSFTKSYYSTNEYDFPKEKSIATAFGIAGVEYYPIKESLFNIGLRITSQIFTTPKGRRLVSMGIRIGMAF